MTKTTIHRLAGLALVLGACGGELAVPHDGQGGGGSAGGAGGAGGAPPAQPEGGIAILGSDCDALVPDHCGLPFPSNVYLDEGAVRFGATTLPTRRSDGVHMAPDMFYDHDGFSPAEPAMTFFPRATTEGCATAHDIEASLSFDSPTVLLDAETLERIPHWVELDMSTSHDDQRLLLIRPAVRLRDGARYIVAIRSLVDDAGQPIPASKVFAALRDEDPLADGTEVERWTVYARHDLYEDIFHQLQLAGVDRTELQVAWDYTTASRQNNTENLLTVRDLALDAVGDEGPSYEIVDVQEFPTEADNPYLLRRIEVEMTVPLYLTSGETSIGPDDPAPALFRGDDGAIAQNGTMKARVLIHVPRTVTGGEPHGLLQNGHGLFGDKFEGQTGFFAKTTFRDHYIGFSMNFFGFDSDAEEFAAAALAGRYELLRSFTERQIQGMVNQLLGMRMMMGRVAADGITDDAGNVLLDPSWVDPSLRAYRGDSQGGIMGATYMAVSTDVTRGLLGEPGMPYSLLLNRSVDWTQYETVLKLGYGDDPIAIQQILSLLQMMWDRVEPTGFAPYLENDPLPGTPAHAVILHAARGDHQVTTFGAHLLARAIGAKQLRSDDPQQPVFEEIFGLEGIDAGAQDTSVLVEYDFGLPPNPDVNLPQAEGCDPHDRVHTLEPSFEQQDVFFRTGVVTWACDGACNCDDSGTDPKSEEGCEASFTDQCR